MTYQPLSKEEIAEIKEREQGIVPAPWLAEDAFIYRLHEQDGQMVNYFSAGIQGGNRTSATAEERVKIATFIAHARTDIPRLLATIEQREARIAELEDRQINTIPESEWREQEIKMANRIAELEAYLSKGSFDAEEVAELLAQGE